MAVYKLNSKKKKEKNPNVKKIVGFSLIAVASVIFLFLTGIVPALQTFFLGLFGVFGFPLCIILCIIGLALVNNRRYVMPKKYTVFLILTVFFALCILQLAIVGNKGDLSFWDYMAKNYHLKWTAGGFCIGIFTTIFLWVANIYGAYIIFALAFVLCLALLLDSLKYMKKQKQEDEPVSVQIKDKKTGKVVEEDAQEEIVVDQKKEKTESEVPNVVLGGNLKEEQAKTEKLTTRQILGLDKKRDRAYEYEEKPTVAQKPVEQPKPKSLRELILTPPQIDIDEYFKDVRKNNAPTPEKEEINQNFDALKNDSSSYVEEKPQQTQTQPTYEQPSQSYVSTSNQHVEESHHEYIDSNPQTSREETHEDNVEDVESQESQKSLPDVKSEELVERADDILRSAIEEEKSENPDIYQEMEQSNPEQNVIDRLPDRNNGGRLDRPSFDRNFGRDREDRNMSQDDRDARDSFERDYDRISARNGMLSRDGNPSLAQEEEEKPKEPYIYEKPPIDFITTQSVDLSTLNEDVAVKRVLLENSLETFGVPAKVQGVVIGPAVTRYELEMPQGISVSKIKNRADDIALSLAAEGSIRIEAPVPGKSVVGIEVPNASIATISLKDVLVSKEFTQGSSPLTFALGKDINGHTICCNMQKLTHLLVAGATGSGKSVCLNAIILSIMYKASPEDVRIILIDPKRVEFSSYEGLPHLIMPEIVCDTQKAINTLSWAVNEMERRFEILGYARVKNIDEYNQTPDVLNGKVEKMPFIVIIVDELADLMMTGKKDVEEKVCRLAQKARAAGIHLILATQRPSVDVITGLIKSNFPSRISFAVTSAVDSMTILDRVGAEKLLGKGDMLYFPNGAKDPMRVQGCFITTNEINNIVDYVRDNNKPIFDKDIEDQINNPNKGSGNGGANYNNDMDPLLPQALKASIECKQASATMIRRRFAIGYPRAARIIDQMEAAGYISSADGVKGRTVYITMEEFEQIFGNVD